ncbi:hypothetical protein EPD60_09625 [Flaviaesturariibacter flavus]|uniref:Uncharacterized protein n=1 Tax=Flaviaesturariibacter flavus TaxID=2502780 RepID=A0A4V2NVP3_9BACT|nr:hypothetical protein [Flaviaesturariibacter flavus]TCJ14252.1 hypothetical protein EPD60_09625 [Flaviaesturariibacter flavus]
MLKFYKYVFFFAAICWLLAILVHIGSIAGFDVGDKVPFIWLLHLGIFIVWIPTILSIRNNEEVAAYQKQEVKRPLGIFKIIFKRTPIWLTIISVLGFYYAVANFFLFAISQQGSVGFINGQRALHNHGRIIKILSEQEYHHYQANEIRGFSGHWIAFYGIATAVLFSFIKKGRTGESPNMQDNVPNWHGA